MAAWERLPLLALGGASLVCGLLAGLARLGWPNPAVDLALLHGPLMVCAFFGTLIGLERAVALRRWWGYGAPLSGGLGGLGLITGHHAMGAVLLGGSSLLFLAMALWVLRRQPTRFTAIMACGAAAWVVGNALWLAGGAVADSVGWWLAFLLLTIAGERVELSRFAPPWRWAGPAALAAVGAVLGALLQGGWQSLGPALLVTAAWLLRIDVARRTVRQKGMVRFGAVCILSGYAWLAAAGMVALGAQVEPGGPAYDAVLHAVFVGFTLSMVMGHAPIILPAVLRVPVPYHPVHYGALALLQLSLAARVAGDLAGLTDLRVWGGLFNALALLVWALSLVMVAVWRKDRVSTL